MKKIFIITLIILLIACNSSSEKLSNKIYSLEDFPKIGWKKKKSFKTEFPESTDAFWGNLLADNFPSFEVTDNKVDTYTATGTQTDFVLTRTPTTNENG